jgi:hypothetical protein
MLFGHNTDVKLGDAVYHVQTEDLGAESALIDTTVYCQGRVVHRRTNNYSDLLPLGAGSQETLRKRIDEQHASVMEEVRGGAFPVEIVAAKPKMGVAKPAGSALALELLNGKTWLNGRRAHLHIAVREGRNGSPVPGAQISLQVDGSAQPAEFYAQTGTDGTARLEFEMPTLGGADPSLLVEATHGSAKGQLKFQLRGKPREREAV